MIFFFSPIFHFSLDISLCSLFYWFSSSLSSSKECVQILLLRLFEIWSDKLDAKFLRSPYAGNLSFRIILPLPLNQLVKIAIFHPAQREGTFFRWYEHALHHRIVSAFPASDPAQHDLIPFFLSRLVFLARGGFIQNAKKLTFQIDLIGFVLQPLSDVRDGLTDEGGLESRGERSLGAFLTAAFGLFLGGCLKEEGMVSFEP